VRFIVQICSDLRFLTRTMYNKMLYGTEPTFTMNLWGKLIPQALIPHSLFQHSNLNPSLSTYTHVYGAFDFNKTSIAPPGTKVMVNKKRPNMTHVCLMPSRIGMLVLQYTTTGILVSGSGRPKQNELPTRWYDYLPMWSCQYHCQ